MLSLNLDKEFFNKKIIVTGASRGLGAEVCKYLAYRGARLALLARTEKDITKLKSTLKNSTKHLAIKVDLSKRDEIKSSINKAIKFLKKIDIVLHIAGGGYGLKDNLITNRDLNLLFQVNLGAAIEINRLIIKNNLKRKNIKIIHVGSIASSEAVGSIGYNVVKSALAAYVRSAGKELYKKNVIVTGILPGGFISKGNAMDRLRKKNRNIYDKFIKTRLPRGKMGNINEILSVLIFLCSNHSSMMGGCLIPVDGGEGKAYQA